MNEVDMKHLRNVYAGKLRRAGVTDATSEHIAHDDTTLFHTHLTPNAIHVHTHGYSGPRLMGETRYAVAPRSRLEGVGRDDKGKWFTSIGNDHPVYIQLDDALALIEHLERTGSL